MSALASRFDDPKEPFFARPFDVAPVCPGDEGATPIGAGVAAGAVTRGASGIIGAEVVTSEFDAAVSGLSAEATGAAATMRGVVRAASPALSGSDFVAGVAALGCAAGLVSNERPILCGLGLTTGIGFEACGVGFPAGVVPCADGLAGLLAVAVGFAPVAFAALGFAPVALAASGAVLVAAVVVAAGLAAVEPAGFVPELVFEVCVLVLAEEPVVVAAFAVGLFA